jgi:hypothetical protein
MHVTVKQLGIVAAPQLFLVYIMSKSFVSIVVFRTTCNVMQIGQVLVRFKLLCVFACYPVQYRLTRLFSHVCTCGEL